jgi:hypothetical protein
MQMQLYTEIQAAISGHMYTKNAHLAGKIGVRIYYFPVNHFVDTAFWHDAFGVIYRINSDYFPCTF